MNIKYAIKQLDYMFTRNYLKIFGEKNSLMVFTFHGLFSNEKEIKKELVFPIPHAGITVLHFRKFI